MNITMSMNEACLLGTIESIAKDSEINYRHLLVEFIKSRKEGVVTNFSVEGLETELKTYYANVYKLTLVEESIFELASYPTELFNNYDTFGLLFFRGDVNGNNRHTVRLLSTSSSTIMYYDSVCGSLVVVNIFELFKLSPLSADLIVLSKKSVPMLEPKIRNGENNDLEGIDYFVNDNIRNFLQSDNALFHYTKKSSALEHILLKEQLKGSNLLSFKDFREGIVPKVAGICYINSKITNAMSL